MKSNPVFQRQKNVVSNGYSSFPMDNLLNMTSCAGYLIPVYWDFLNPGDKVNLRTLLRTKTQPLSSPAMATAIERIEWFAVPIDQLYKPFSTKFYGINDISTDLLQTSQYDNKFPWVGLSVLNDRIASFPTSFGQQSSLPSSVVTPVMSEAKRLCDALGLPKTLGLKSGNIYPASVSVFPFAAYHKIYFDHYRLTDREVNDPEYYNFDSYMGTSTVSAEVTNSARLNKLLVLHKRPYMRDYFTSMQVSPLFGSQDVNASGADLGAIQNWLSGLSKVDSALPLSNATTFPSGGVTQSSGNNPTTVRVPSTGNLSGNHIMGAFNPDNIRSLFAVEKLLTVTRNAKKHYDMQTLAHFGVDVPKGLSGECFKIGTHEQYLNIGEVISTANTENGSLGELGGRGSSEGGSKPMHFEAKCHCVLMAIYSCEPVVNIMNEGIPRIFSMVDSSDWYRSEFDSLGMQPVFYKELFSNYYQSQVSGAPADNYNNVIGWQPRYQQLKGKYNRSIMGCSSEFFQEWALNRTSISSIGSSLSKNFFYVWPTDLDNILLVPYGTDIPFVNTYSTDYLINQIYFDVQKASKMSIFGTPKL